MLRIEAVKSDKEFARDFTVLRDNYLESLRTARKQRNDLTVLAAREGESPSKNRRGLKRSHTESSAVSSL